MLEAARQQQCERGSARLRREIDLALHRLRELAGDREAEPAPRRPAGAVPAVEALEDLNCLLRADPRPVASTTRQTRSQLRGRVPARGHGCRRACTVKRVDESAPDLENPRLIAEAGSRRRRPRARGGGRFLGTSFELFDEEFRDVREIDGVTIDTEAPCVKPGQVEQLAREFGQRSTCSRMRPRNSRFVASSMSLSRSSSRWPPSERAGCEADGSVGDELAACMLEPGQAQAHAVEGAGQLAELVRARTLDRLVELAVRDPLGGPFEVADAAGEEARARPRPSRRAATSAITAEISTRFLTRSTVANGPSRELERGRLLRLPAANGSAASAYFCPRTTTPRAVVKVRAAASATASVSIPTTVPPPPHRDR